MDQDQAQGGGISRRSVLKRAAVGGAVVWAAPVVTSLTTPAFAQGSPSCTEETCSKVTIGGRPVYFRCAPAPGQEGCLCACGGAPDTGCSLSDPCTVTIVCVPDPTCTIA